MSTPSLADLIFNHAPAQLTDLHGLTGSTENAPLSSEAEGEIESTVAARVARSLKDSREGGNVDDDESKREESHKHPRDAGAGSGSGEKRDAKRAKEGPEQSEGGQDEGGKAGDSETWSRTNIGGGDGGRKENSRMLEGLPSFEALDSVTSVRVRYNYTSRPARGEHLLHRQLLRPPPQTSSSLPSLPPSPPQVHPITPYSSPLLSLNKTTYFGNTGEVFSTSLLPDGTSLALKYSHGPDFNHYIERESLFYQSISPMEEALVGVLPKCFGMWWGGRGIERNVLMLENVGVPLNREMKEYPVRAREKLLSALYRIHELGWFHFDLRKDNILVDSSNNLRLIDFSHVRKHRGCLKEECGEIKEFKQLLELE